MYAQELMDKLLIQLNEMDEGREIEIAPDGPATDPIPNSTTYKIKVIGARNLTYQGSAPDAYCVMTLGGQIVGATYVVRRNKHPVWHCEYSVNLPDSLNTNTKAFLNFNVYHDNTMGSEVSLGRCVVFLRDEIIQNCLTHNITLGMRPQGSLTFRIRREGEVNDTEWYVQRTQETLRFTLEDLVRVFSVQVRDCVNIRYVESLKSPLRIFKN
jgi:hypothetical protein